MAPALLINNDFKAKQKQMKVYSRDLKLNPSGKTFIQRTHGIAILRRSVNDKNSTALTNGITIALDKNKNDDTKAKVMANQMHLLETMDETKDKAHYQDKIMPSILHSAKPYLTADHVFKMLHPAF